MLAPRAIMRFRCPHCGCDAGVPAPPASQPSDGESPAAPQKPPLLSVIGERLAAASGRYPGLTEMAGELHISARTLKRRLAAHGVSYRELLDQQRRQASVALLLQAHLSLDTIAERLGYCSTANFSRAFRRWTGLPPGLYRSRQLVSSFLPPPGDVRRDEPASQ